ncbi:MAG: hypothetical protein AB7M05_21025 [Alphaproteobacteria bacterium]
MPSNNALHQTSGATVAWARLNMLLVRRSQGRIMAASTADRW